MMTFPLVIEILKTEGLSTVYCCMYFVLIPRLTFSEPRIFLVFFIIFFKLSLINYSCYLVHVMKKLGALGLHTSLHSTEIGCEVTLRHAKEIRDLWRQSIFPLNNLFKLWFGDTFFLQLLNSSDNYR